MPNQDLLYSILPRAPSTPGSGDFHRDITRIQKEPVIKKTEVHKDPAEHSAQDEYHPSHGRAKEESADMESTPEVESHKSDEGEAPEHVDIFV
ncbi:MAG: hypothetical protein ACRCRW_00125 [Aeromonadaceae bacterium]